MTNIDKKIQLLTIAVEKLVANPVLPVAPVAPVAPILPIAQIHNGDHDILTSFRSESLVEFRTIKEAIKELNDGTSKRISDLENEKLNTKDSYPVLYKKDVEDRLDKLENKTQEHNNIITKMWSYGVALIFLVGIVEFLLSTFLRR